MNIEDLIKHVGSENLMVQSVSNTTVDAKVHRSTGLTHLTIATNQYTPDDLLAAMAGLPPKKVGLVLWIDRDRLPEELK